LAHDWYGVQDSYSKTVLTLWKLSPIHGWRQSILIVIAWIHGCIGFHFWLRLRPWYSRYAQTFFALALLLPVLALLGGAAGYLRGRRNRINHERVKRHG
jgi:adenylate cyclase